jgi:hypothetical protein
VVASMAGIVVGQLLRSSRLLKKSLAGWRWR